MIYTFEIVGALCEVPAQFEQNLRRCQCVEILIDSSGGDLQLALWLGRCLRRSGKRVVTRAYKAFSAALVLMQFGTWREIYKNGWLLLHSTSTPASGSAKELQVYNDVLQAANRYTIEFLSQRSGRPAADFEKFFEGGDFLVTATAAVGMGLADEIFMGRGAARGLQDWPRAAMGAA